MRPENVTRCVCRPLAAIVLLSAVLGCKAERAKVYPVRGRLLINGLPAEKAAVYFHPHTPIAGGNTTPFGIVASDGSYQPGTYGTNDGLPGGKYLVTVVWPQMIDFDGLETPGEDRLRGRYADPEQPVTTVTIDSSSSQLPLIELEL